MDFSEALKCLKNAEPVAREGWNGKGMFVYLVPGNRYPPTTQAGHDIAEHHEDGLVPYKAYLAIKSVDGEVAPWLPSQTDVLADDWVALSYIN